MSRVTEEIKLDIMNIKKDGRPIMCSKGGGSRTEIKIKIVPDKPVRKYKLFRLGDEVNRKFKWRG